MRKGSHHTPEARRKLALAQSDGKRTRAERAKRIELFAAAADIESGACRLQKLGFKADYGALMSVVIELRRLASRL